MYDPFVDPVATAAYLMLSFQHSHVSLVAPDKTHADSAPTIVDHKVVGRHYSRLFEQTKRMKCSDRPLNHLDF